MGQKDPLFSQRDPAAACGALCYCRLSAGGEMPVPERSLRAARTHLQPTPAAHRPVWPTLRSSRASRLASSGVILLLLALGMAPPAATPGESPPISRRGFLSDDTAGAAPPQAPPFP